MKSSLDLIAKLKMAVNLKKEEEIESNEIELEKEEKIKELNTDSAQLTASSSFTSLHPEKGRLEPNEALPSDKLESQGEIDGLSRTLRVTRKECQF
jgi:hypothetical protein